MKNLLPILMAAALLVFTGAASAQDDLHVIDTQKVRVPAPEGWTNIFPTVHWLAERIAQGEKSGNVAAAAFVPDDMAKKLIAGERPEPDHYAKMTVPYSLLKVDVTPEMFERYADNEVKKYPSPAQGGTDRAGTGRRVGTAAVGSSDVHLKYRKTPNVFTGLVLTTVETDGKTQRVATSRSMVNVKDRLILLYVYRPYTGHEDANALLDFTEKWTDRIVAANEEAR